MQTYKIIKKIKQKQRKAWFDEEIQKLEDQMTPLKQEIALLEKQKWDLIKRK